MMASFTPLLLLLLTTTALAPFAACGTDVKADNGYLQDYSQHLSQEVYRPAPYATIDDVTPPQCAENCSKQPEPGCKHFEHCSGHGRQQRGVCRFFSSDNARIKTRPADNCTFYTTADPAEIGIPHGVSPTDGASSRMTGTLGLLVLLPIIVAASTLRSSLV